MASAQIRGNGVGAHYSGIATKLHIAQFGERVVRNCAVLGFMGAISLLVVVAAHLGGEEKTLQDGSTMSRADIEYANVRGHSLRMDAHVPDGPGPFPAAIIVHGGGWVTGDRNHSVQPLFQPLSDAGYAWFSISYRLAKGVGSGSTILNGIAPALVLGSAIDDVRRAIAYVKQHASEYRVDASRIALIGESAGAQLASVAALQPGQNGAVRGVVALYSPSDLVKLARTSHQIPDWARHAVGGTVWEEKLLASLRDLSPVTWVRKDAPPFLLIHGTADNLVPFEQSNLMCQKMRAVGGTCEVYAVKDGGHGILWWEFLKLTAYKQHMVRWLEQELGVGAACHDRP